MLVPIPLCPHDVYGEEEKAKRLFRELPQVAQKLSGVDFRAASAACPHGVDVVAHMDRPGCSLRSRRRALAASLAPALAWTM